jgi:plastocyanin
MEPSVASPTLAQPVQKFVSTDSVAATADRTSIMRVWRALLRGAATVDLALLLGAGILLHDREPLGLAIVVGLGLWLLHVRGGLVGTILLGLVCADVAAFMVPAAVINAATGTSTTWLLLASALGLVSAMACLAAIASRLHWTDSLRARWAPLLLVLAAGLAFVGLVVAGLGSAQQAQASTQQTSLVLAAEGLKFSPSTLNGTSGQTTVRLANHVLFWHTFTIDALNVDLRVPVGAEQSVTFTAPSGSYAFYCAIPGHESLGMRGTLTVR